MNHFSKNLRYLLVKYGVKQSQLAAHIGKSQNSISNWIHEISAPDLRDLVGISNYFSLPMDDLARVDLEKSRTITTQQVSRFRKKLRNATPGNRVSRLYATKPAAADLTLQEPEASYGQAIVNHVKNIQLNLDELKRTVDRLMRDKRL